MDPNVTSELVVNFSQLIDVLAIVLSIVALVVTVIGFFASLKFYREGMGLQQLANDVLVKIEEKASSIQTQVGGMFEKTLDAAIANREQLSTNFNAINKQIKKTGSDIVDAALKEIGTAGVEERKKLKSVVDVQLMEIHKLVEATRANAEEAVSEMPSSKIFRSPIMHRILRTLKAANDWLSVPDIAKHTGMPKSLTMHRLHMLLKDGQVQRKIEGRRLLYRLTVDTQDEK